MESYKEELYLQHHGIFGQRWGKRNGPPYPLDYGAHSSAEKNKNPKSRLDNYEKKINHYKEKISREKQTGKDDIKEWKEIGKYHNRDVSKDIARSKEITKNNIRKYEEKIDRLTAKASGKKVKSQHRLNIEKKFMEAGYSKEEAKKLADKRIKTEIALGIIGGTAVAAVATYFIVKKGKDYCDSSINLNEKLYRIKGSASEEIRDIFYATPDKKENIRYMGFFGPQKLSRNIFENGSNSIYNHTMNANTKLKIASDKNAKKIFDKFVENNPQYSSEIKEIAGYADLLKAFSPKGDRIKSDYDNFNVGISQANAKNDPKLTNVLNEFGKALKESGYAGVKDINDRKLSDYNAKNAVIIFDKSKLSSEGLRSLNRTDLNKINVTALKDYNVDQAVDTFIKRVGIYGAELSTATGLAYAIDQNKNSKFVKKKIRR